METHALDGIDLSIHPGEYVAISGPSGCGKSTLLSILGLLDSPTTGDYTLNGQPVAQLSQADRAPRRSPTITTIASLSPWTRDLPLADHISGWIYLQAHAVRRLAAARWLAYSTEPPEDAGCGVLSGRHATQHLR